MVHPVVSVCIPSYNHGEYLPDAIESVLDQSFGDLECIVFDDGSADGSWDTAIAYQERDNRVRALSHPQRANRGIAATLNAAYAAARGEYVAHFAADDLLLRDSLVRRVEPLQRHTNLGFVYGRIEMLTAEGRPTGEYGGVAADAMCRFDATDDPLQSLLLHCYVPSPTVLARRDALAAVGTFAESVYYSDWEFWIRFLAHRIAPAFVDGAPLVACRPGAYGDEADLPRRLEFFRALVARPGDDGDRLAEPRVRALIHLQEAFQAAQMGDRQSANEALSAAFVVDPSLRQDPRYLFWWLSPVQRRQLPDGDDDRSRLWSRRLADPRVTPEMAITAGAAAGHAGCWAVDTARMELPAEELETLQWALIANELELDGCRLRLGLLVAGIVRLARRPTLARQRWFAKALLCTAGLWPVAARVRRSIDLVRAR